MPYKDPEKRKKFQQAYREKHKDKLREANQRYYADNKEKLLEDMREYRDQNREKINESSRLYYSRNKEAISKRMKEYHLKYYELNKDRLLEYNKEYVKGKRVERAERLKKSRHLRAEWLAELKSELCCIHCGESDPACLEFHHVNPEDKHDVVSRMVHQAASWERIMEEIEKCDVYCSNCHRKYHAGRLNFPGNI